MCVKLAFIELPSGLKYLYNHAFAGTAKLKVDITIPGTLMTPPAESFEKELYSGYAVGYYAFKNSGITGVTFEEGIESIGYAAFYECRNMTGTVTIPSTCTLIGGKAFANTPITDAYVPSTVTSIGSLAFNRKSGDSLLALHTEADAEYVIKWAEIYTEHLTCTTDYVPAGDDAAE